MANSQSKKKIAGFTLPEILVALAIFSILSVMMMTALHSVLGSQQKTEEMTQRLREVQMGLLLFSRDLSQTIARPVLNDKGVPQPAFSGDNESFSFTHMGYASLNPKLTRSNLQRVHYSLQESGLWRNSWDVLDLVPKSAAHRRLLIDGVEKIQLQYVDDDGRLHDMWPPDVQATAKLPRGMVMTLTLDKWGTMTQAYVILGAASSVQNKPA